MTENQSENDNVKAPFAAKTSPLESAPAQLPKSEAASMPKVSPASTPPAPKSGRGVAWLALLVGLGASGGSGYLWYLWQKDQATQASRLDQAIKQAIAQRDPEFQALKAQVQQLQGLKTGLDQARADQQALKEQLLGLTGDLQPLKSAMELHKGESELIKGEMKLLRESHDAHKASVQKQNVDVGAQLQDYLNRLAQQNEQLQNLKLSHGGLNDQLETIRTLVAKGGDVNAFPLAEVDYLLRLADAKLKLERNVAAARLALEVAQQRLKAVNENAMASVQTMLGEAIASLRGVKLPDLSALAHKVAEMQKAIGGLPLRITSGIPDIKNRVKPAANISISTDTERSWWDRGIEAVGNQFKDIVVIRRVRSDAPPLIAMEEEFFLRQNLRLELESLRTALLRGDAEAYRDSYDLVNRWVETYFDTQDKQVAAFLAELKALQTVEFNPYVPDLTGLNQAFGEAMAHRQPIRAMGKTQAPPAESAAKGEGQP
ncbi:MAG: uroporphyrinogen-III C-methyltransferase [Candidatus Competibacteraceae bacterium]